MAGDIGIKERVVILPQTRALEGMPSLATNAKRRVVHMYGPRLAVMEDESDSSAERASREFAEPSTSSLSSLSPEERLGYAAYVMRESPEYQAAKSARPRDGESWDASPETQHSCTQIDESTGLAREALAGAPTSQRLTGSVAVGIIIVEGPNANLKFSQAERTKVIAEVQNGLSWLATQNPEGLVFKYDIKIVTLNLQPGAKCSPVRTR
jgi:hypothetical protein